MSIPSGSSVLSPMSVLEPAGVGPGMQVADFGCGTLGHFVFAASPIVGEKGKVYAVDIMKSTLATIENKMKAEGVGNMVTVWTDLERYGGAKILDESLDVGLIINNVFMAKDKHALMKECSRMVKKGGRVVVVEWKPGLKGLGPAEAQRVQPAIVLDLAKQIGLRLEKEFKPGPYHYGFVFVK